MRHWLAVITVVAAALAASAPAQADDGGLLGCEGQEFSHPFSRWLDPLPYTLVENGDFSSAPGWELSGGARLAPGGNRYGSGGTALYLPHGSSATSPWICVGLLHPTLRYFTRNTGSPLAPLRVDVLYRAASGSVRSVPLLPALADDSWIPSLPTPVLLNLLGPVLTGDGLTTEIAFRFTPQKVLFFTGKWWIDDVYVDPWLSRG